MKNKVYEIATQEERWVYHPVVTKTNCKRHEGHQYEWIYGEEAEIIRAQHPHKLRSAIVKCIHCGKVNSSM